jgi:UDP-GlcNAc:undecaprenyl-phosphate GlcNAc-1-phosphate transferase
MLLPAYAIALGLALALTPLTVRLAWAIGYLDHPEARKLHTAATALLGGAVVFASALIAWWIALRIGDRPIDALGPQVLPLVSGAAISLAWGLWDDRFGMGVRLKLVGQLLAGACLVAAGAIPDFGLPDWIEIAIMMFTLVALMNAVNFLDNMNGMIAGYAAIAMLGFAFGSILRHSYGLAAAQLALAGACVGFLPWNFPKARIFLGDAGSLLLGYSLGASAILGFTGMPVGWGRWGTLFALAYPAFDIIFVVVTRLRDGRKVQQGGKDHSNHRIARWIQCPKRTVILLWVSGAVLSVSGLVVQSLNRPIPLLLSWGLWMVIFLWMGRRLSSVPSQ